MSDPQFFQTAMGKAFYERNVPRLAKALERIADALETVRPAPIEIDGRRGTVVFLDAEQRPVAKAEDATSARVLFDDGGTLFLLVSPAEKE